MLYLHAILILLSLILPIRRCDGSLFHPVSYRKHRDYTSNVLNKRRVKKNVAFMVNVVPRGGADIDYFDSEELIDSSEYEDTDIVDSDDEEIDPILDLSLGLEPSKFSFLSNIHIMHYAHVLIRVTKRACIAGVRAVMMNENNINGSDVEDNSEEDNGRPVVNTILGRGAYVVGQMYHAALTPPEDDDCIDELDIAAEGEERTHERRRKRRKQHTDDQQPHRHRRRMTKKKKQMYTSSPTAIPSCGGIEESHDAAILQLAKQYNINFLSNKPLSKRYTSILLSSQITLNEALQKANADARFLICYISKGGPNNTNNLSIMPHLLSSDVVKMINRKPLGKKQTGDTASYYIWITNDDKDVELAMKRLKVKPPTSRNSSSKKKKSKKSNTAPILTIVYPSTAIDPSSGGNKLTVSPKVLTQHHCHPPPSTSDNLISWMNTIRKRHLREYNKLQHDRKEFQLLKERTEGYAESQQQDKAREEKDEMMKQKKREEEKKEQARIQQILDRRKELLENLVEEPDMGEESVITIALRFTDGVKRDMSTCKRRFDASTSTTNDVFNWIDAVHEMEREKVELSTMNGAKKFVYGEDGEEQTLEGAGLGKMTALRVSEIVKVEDDAKEDETGEEEEEEESVEEDESEEYDDESEYDSDEEE